MYRVNGCVHEDMDGKICVYKDQSLDSCLYRAWNVEEVN